MGLARTRSTGEDQPASFGDPFRSEVASEQRLAYGGLEFEVELLDGAQEREASVPSCSLDARLGAVTHAFDFRALLELGVEPADGRQMQPLEQTVQIDGLRRQGRRRRAGLFRCGTHHFSSWVNPHAIALA